MVAVDTALRPLLSRGIQPHIIVAADPMNLNYRHFANLESLEPSLLAFLPECNYQILEKFPAHQKLLCLHDLESKTLRKLAPYLGVGNKFRRGMNVGYCAFSLARQMGCSPLILIGMDLALSSDGNTHAGNTANLSKVHYSSDNKTAEMTGNVNADNVVIIEVDGYYGGKVKTFASFYQYILHYEEDFAEMTVPVIDATEGGARKRGAIEQPLHAVLHQYPGTRDMWQFCHSLPTENSVANIAKIRTILIELFQQTQTAARQMQINGERLQRRLQQIQVSRSPRAAVEKEILSFFTHWQTFLNSDPLDTAIDIGLARWRHEIRTNRPPEELDDQQWLTWWQEQFQQWIEGVNKDLQLYLQIYTIAIQSLHPRQ